jgi:hypothetical protein
VFYRGSDYTCNVVFGVRLAACPLVTYQVVGTSTGTFGDNTSKLRVLSHRNVAKSGIALALGARD